jgi:pimeloyl-ACP methyl ester carboxylesterase
MLKRLVRDGVALGYLEAGEGGPPIVLVHGASCDHTYFQPQFEHFRRRHRVLVVDLRGHGASDAPDQAYTPEVYADDLAWICRALGVRRPVVVGHSMGGIAALALAASHPDLPAAIALLDSPLFVPESMRGMASAVVEAIQGPGGMDVWRQILEQSFSPLDDPDRRARILEATGRAPHHVVASSFVHGARWDEAAAARACKVPALYVRASALIDLRRFRAACPHLMTGETVGAGHFHQLEVPEQINAMLDRFLRSVPA